MVGLVWYDYRFVGLITGWCVLLLVFVSSFGSCLVVCSCICMLIVLYTFIFCVKCLSSGYDFA